MAVIAVIACCDTKYHEISFVREKIKRSGNVPLILDISTGPNIPMEQISAGTGSWRTEGIPGNRFTASTKAGPSLQ